MSLIVEDGTGLTNAVSYASVAEADAYHSAMGFTGWTGVDAVKEVALRKATQYMDIMYRWRGYRRYTTQALENPRYDPDMDITRDDLAWPPRGLKEACSELALRALSGDLILDVEDDRPITREKVGPLETVYGVPTNSNQPVYMIAARLLRGLIKSRGSSLRIVRSS